MSTPNLIEFNRSVTAYCAVRKGYYLTCPQANGESKVEHSPHIKDATKGTFYDKKIEKDITKLSWTKNCCNYGSIRFQKLVKNIAYFRMVPKV